MSARLFPSRSGMRPVPLAALVFAGAVVLRLVVLFRFTDSPLFLPHRGDMQFYHDWAQRILRGQWTDHHAFYGLPLYAYLLAALYKFGGVNPFIPGFLQALLEGGTAVLLLKLGRLLFLNFETHGRWRGECIGLVAALGWICFLPAQAYSVILMPAAWLVFVFWLVVWQIVSRDTASLGLCFALGCLIGFAAMGIATVLFLLPLLLVAAIWKWRSNQQTGLVTLPAAQRVLSIIAGLALGVSPCVWHNYFVAHDPVLLSAHSGVNFWIGNNPIADGYPRFPPGLPAGQEAMLRESVSVAEAAAGHPLPRSEVSAFWSQKANTYIWEHPGAWLVLLATKLGRFWSSFQYDDLSIITTLREQHVLLPGIGFGLVAALAWPGMIVCASKVPLSRWLIAAIFLHMAALLPVFVTERYRLAVVPGLLLFAAFGLWELGESFVQSRYSWSLGYTMALAVSAWVVSTPLSSPALWALDSYNSGWQALEARNFSLAEKKLGLAYAYVPDNAEINFALGNLALEKGDTSRAGQFYDHTLILNPTHQGALNNLGLIALDAHELAAAEQFFRRALTLSAFNPKTHYLLARTRLQSGDKAGARLEADKAVELNPQQPQFRALAAELAQP